MATELARTLPPKELIEKGICPIKKEYIVDESNAHVRKEVEVVGSVVAKQQPERKKSGTQLKKVRLTHDLRAIPPARCTSETIHDSVLR